MAVDRRTRTRPHNGRLPAPGLRANGTSIAGLEKALAGLGLLDEALRFDLRRPQDYFQRIWSTNFRARDLADISGADDADALIEEVIG